VWTNFSEDNIMRRGQVCNKASVLEAICNSFENTLLSSLLALDTAEHIYALNDKSLAMRMPRSIVEG